MKKISFKKLSLVLGLGVVGVSVGLSATSCSTKTETQIMIDLYKDREKNPNRDSINEQDEYFALWKNLASSSSKVNGSPEISWCLEYSLYSPYLFDDDLTLINSSAAHIKLLPDQSLWKYFIDGYLQPQFLTKINDVKIDSINSDRLLFSFTGYLHLMVLKQFNLVKIAGSTTEPYPLQKNSVIEILFTFSNIIFSTGNVVRPLQGGNQYTQDIEAKIIDQFVGALGNIYIYDELSQPVASNSINKVKGLITSPNYFGAYDETI